MRKSAAPSQSAKRPKFEPPFRPTGTTRPTCNANILPVQEPKNFEVLASAEKHLIDKENASVEETQGSSVVRSTADILKLIQTTPTQIQNVAELKPPVKTEHLIGQCRSNVDQHPALQALESIDIVQKLGVEIEEDNSKYFNVMWCKLSKKKHKKWEGDAVLIIRGRTAVLRDLEGKEIGRSSGYKQKEIEVIEDGQTLFVGGKECEIQNEISKNVYLSGQCFTKSSCTADEIPKISCETTSKSFVLPFKDKSQQQKTTLIAVKPKYSTENPNAIILPRPNQTHQWKNNVNQLPIVDVVIDPKLAVHLRPHQREGVVFLYECVMGIRNYAGLGAILADEMGLGKTLQCIALLWTLMKQGPYGGKPVIKRALVITPSSLIKNWLQEFCKWLGQNKLAVYAVDQQHTVQNFARCQNSGVLLISYEMFVRSFDILEAMTFDIVICDEGHRLKNSNIKTSSLITRLRTLRRIVLTGTPIQNDLGEFYSIVEFCNPGIIGTPNMFKQVYGNPIIKGQQPNASSEEHDLGKARAEELTRLTSMFVLRRTQDVINKYMPSKVECVVICRAVPLQILLYNHILQSKILRSCVSASGSMDGSCHLACITILKKLCNHPYLLYRKSLDSQNDLEGKDSLYKQMRTIFPEAYSHFSEIPIESDSGKLFVLSSFLEVLYDDGPKEKIVLVSGYTQTLDLLQELCKRRNYSFLRLDGSTPTMQRQKLVNTFNSSYSKHFVFLLSSKAGGLGLNLIGASRIVLYDIDWNPATDLQAMARIWRDGQRRNVHIYRLLTAGTIEEKIYQRQVTKQGISGAVIDASDTGKVKFSLDDLRDLFTFQEDAICTTHDLLRCSCQGNFKAATLAGTPQENKERSCQLGGQHILPHSEKNVSMATLMKWDHISESNSSQFQDKYLESTTGITFILRNEVRRSTES